MDNSTCSEKNFLIIGLGLSGRSAANFLLQQGAKVFATDKKLTNLLQLDEIQDLKKKGLITYHESEIDDVTHFDALIVSPGVHSSHLLVQLATAHQVPCFGEIELGCLFTNQFILGITGTNGKTTVTLLISHILNENQLPAFPLGNVGHPLTQAISSLLPTDKIVLELSSYQLETMQQPVLDAGVILNITPDHLDRYTSIHDYAKAKSQLAKCLKDGSILYINEQVIIDFPELLDSQKMRLYGYQKNCYIYSDGQSVFREGKWVFDLPVSLKGHFSHHVENLLAAYALCSDLGITSGQFLQSYQTFRHPPHRLEYVCKHKNVTYIDDSKGTNIDAVLRAVQSIQGNILLIAGGVDKGSSYLPWIQGFEDKVKSICAIGQAAAKIKAQLASIIPVTICQTLKEAVWQASLQASAGDYVLLSPGCSSFDMFKDYVHRGKEFQRYVHEWTKEV